mmetsp:Transcript_46470/g.123417  ORF Transcript_46470/g.123417 Transcript_46470/m.123417 type:complete len:635 (-) Transcript_46470:100-2004(-)
MKNTSVDEICAQMTEGLIRDLEHVTVSFRTELEQHLDHYHARIADIISIRRKDFAEMLGHSVNVVEDARDVHDINTPPSKAIIKKEASQSFQRTVRVAQSTRSSDSRWLPLPDTRSTISLPTKEQLEILYREQAAKADTLLSRFSLSDSATRKWMARLKRRRLGCNFAAAVVGSRVFIYLVGFLILANAVHIGIASDYAVSTTMSEYYRRDMPGSFENDRPLWDVYGERVFTVLFLVELLLRILAEELEFFFGAEWAWNLLDLVLVLCAVVDTVVSAESNLTGGIGPIRLLRTVRVVRTLRGVRLLKLFAKFRLLLLVIQHSLVPLMWSCFVLVWIFYLVGIVLIYGVANYVGGGEADGDTVDELDSLFGGLHWAMLTLFMSITGGVNWTTVVTPMFTVDLFYGFLIILFMVGMTLAMLNIIAGIFLNEAIDSAQMNRHIVAQAQISRDRVMFTELVKLFKQFDKDQSGSLTLDELADAWELHDLGAQFRYLGIEFVDAVSLFQTLDVDSTEMVEIDEFVMGCLRLQSQGKPLDLQSYSRENKRYALKFRRQLDALSRDIHGIECKIEALITESLRNRQESRYTPRSKWHGTLLLPTLPQEPPVSSSSSLTPIGPEEVEPLYSCPSCLCQKVSS